MSRALLRLRSGGATVVGYRPYARRFVDERFGEQPLRLRELGPRDVSSFIVRHADSMSPGRVKLMVTALRSLLTVMTVFHRVMDRVARENRGRLVKPVADEVVLEFRDGQVTRSRDGDLFGDTVNSASKIHTSAEPGQIVLSAEVAEAVECYRLK